MTATKNRPTLEDQLKATQDTLKDAQVEHAHACLLAEQNPKDAAAGQLVEQLEDEIRTHEKKIGRLQAAIIARGERTKTESTDAVRARVAEIDKITSERAAEVQKVTAAICEQIEAIAPLLARVSQAAIEHRELIREAMRPIPLHERIKASTGTELAPVSAYAITQALHRAGFFTNQVGAMAAKPTGAVARTDLTMDLLEKQRSRVRNALQQALECALEPR